MPDFSTLPEVFTSGASLDAAVLPATKVGEAKRAKIVGFSMPVDPYRADQRREVARSSKLTSSCR